MVYRLHIVVLTWLLSALDTTGMAGQGDGRASFRNIPVPSAQQLCAKILAQDDAIKTVTGSVAILFPQGTALFDPRDLRELESILNSAKLHDFLNRQGVIIDVANAQRVSGRLPRGARSTSYASLLGLENVIDIVIPANSEFLDPRTALHAAGRGYHPICYPPCPEGTPAFFNPAFHWIVNLEGAAKRMKETSFAAEVQQTVRNNELTVTWNSDFAQVLRKTLELRTADNRGALSQSLIDMYQGAFETGDAYSIEVWRQVFVDGRSESRMVAATFGFTHSGLVTIEDGFTDLTHGKGWKNNGTGGHWIANTPLGEDAGRAAILALIDRMRQEGDLRQHQLRLSSVNPLTKILDPQPILRVPSVNALKELRRQNRTGARLSSRSGKHEIDWTNW